MTRKAKQLSLIALLGLAGPAFADQADPVSKGNSEAASVPPVSQVDPSGPSSTAAAQATQPVASGSETAVLPAKSPKRVPIARALRGKEIDELKTESTAGEPDINTSLDTTAMAQQIRAATIHDRPVLLEALAERIAAGDEDLLETKRMAAQLQWQARKQYRAALKEYKLRRNQLDSRISDARRARAEEWADVQNGLSVDYQAYWATLTRLTGFATGGTP